MEMSKEQHDELATAYAALILYDGDAEINAEQLTTVIEASGNEVEPYWPMLFSKLLKNNNIEELIAKPTAGGAAVAAGPVAGGADAGAGAAAGDDKKKKEEEEEEEADLGGGMDMFGGGDADY